MNEQELKTLQKKFNANPYGKHELSLEQLKELLKTAQAAEETWKTQGRAERVAELKEACTRLLGLPDYHADDRKLSDILDEAKTVVRDIWEKDKDLKSGVSEVKLLEEAIEQASQRVAFSKVIHATLSRI